MVKGGRRWSKKSTDIDGANLPDWSFIEFHMVIDEVASLIGLRLQR